MSVTNTACVGAGMIPIWVKTRVFWDRRVLVQILVGAVRRASICTKASPQPAQYQTHGQWGCVWHFQRADYLGNEAKATEQFAKQYDNRSRCCEAGIPPLTNLNNLNSTYQNQVNNCCDQGKGLFINNNSKVTNINPNRTTTSSSTSATATEPSSRQRPLHHHQQLISTASILGPLLAGS